MSLDPMAVMVDWLDAYRSRDLETILLLYADDAIIECGCGGGTTLSGRHAVRAYWQQRLIDFPVSELDNLQPANDGTAITYLCKGSPVRGDFKFNTAGQITFQNCGPLK